MSKDFEKTKVKELDEQDLKEVSGGAGGHHTHRD